MLRLDQKLWWRVQYQMTEAHLTSITKVIQPHSAYRLITESLWNFIAAKRGGIMFMAEILLSPLGKP